MAIATTTALLIGSSIAAAATRAYAAKKEGDANTEATNAQVAAADEALAVQQQMYDQQRSDLAPYRNAGGWSAGELGRLAGMPAGWSLAPTYSKADIGAAKAGGASAGLSGPADPFAAWDAATAEPGYDSTIPGAPGPRGAPRGTPLDAQAAMSLRDLGAQQQTRSSFVRIQTPDGETADVSPEEADFYESRGARRIS